MKTTMNSEKVIEAAYEGMADPGAFDWFSQQVKDQMEKDFDPDPVAVTISHAVRDNIDLDGVASTMEYYAFELKRAAEAIRRMSEECSNQE